MTAEAPTSARKTAPNVRLVEPLKSEASAKAKSLGISLNALVSMAVRQYLDGQSSPATLGVILL
ncbi:toxin-antitoxin system HicB family antitoxin [Xanthomonas citri pv. citri]|nr:toxin-antitoxin system HicB family antitoxin [Xanthomonas citri pv. citri]